MALAKFISVIDKVSVETRACVRLLSNSVKTLNTGGKNIFRDNDDI
jgi:hypothetical protein